MLKSKTWTLIGVFLTSMSILVMEIALTRIFSVLMWYHFAFLATSLALLGSGTAGVWLYLFARHVPPDKSAERLTLLALLFALVSVGAFLAYLQIPFDMNMIRDGVSWGEAGWLTLIYMVLALPFLLGGATLALSVSRFSEMVGQVYFVDLLGGSLGCLVSVWALTALGGANAILLVGVLGGCAALCFALSATWPGWRVTALVETLLLAGLLIGNQLGGWILVRGRSGYDADRPILLEKWNALSRVTVYEDPWWLQPFGWGLSPTYKGPDPGHLLVLIDSKAGTPIQKWTPNDWATIDFLRYDLTSLAYYVLPQANSFIIGPGGGRDVLTGLLFQARQITGVELNPAIIEAARHHFGDYAGHVYDYSNVHIQIEDARTYLARSHEQFDLIQASLIDTWAASSSGAFALSENGLYTREAFMTYYRRLSERGMVSFSRWYFIQDPAETLRMVALGLDAWQRSGVSHPADHIIVMANLAQNRSATEGLATMLLKKTPFTAAEVQTLRQIGAQMEFTVLYAPGLAADNPVSDLVLAADLRQAIAAYPLDISPPTDDRPFFFNLVRLGSRLSAERRSSPVYLASAEANQVLYIVLGISLSLTVLFMLGPLALRRDRAFRLAQSWSELLYFAALGIGFMLVEIPLVQRLAVYLGSPTYALVVVLLTILLSSGIGSLSTHPVAPEQSPRRLRWVVPALIGVLILQLLLLPMLLQWTQRWSLIGRVLMGMAAILPVGLLMGQPFPLGVKWARERHGDVIPWLWAVNGAASVVGSSLATILALHIGFSAVSLGGMLCYALAAVVVNLVWQRPGVR